MTMHAVLCAAAVLLLAAQAPAAESVLDNPSFEDSLAGWSRYPQGVRATVAAEGGRAVLTIAAGEEEKADEWRQVTQRFEAKPGERFVLRADTRARALRDGHGLIVSLAFLDADGTRISFVDSYLSIPTEGWTPAVCRAEAPAGTARGLVLLMLHGRGEASFAEPRLTRVPGPEAPPEGTATLTVTEEVACPALVGFGAEDDGWAYSAHNRAHGADEAGFALRESRIAWMEPDWVRMFFWYNDWNPSMDGKTYTWDSDGMQSHYRTLDLYQRLGTQVTVTGVEWAVADPWGDPPVFAGAVGDLLEHLIVEKGYTCIKYWTLTNEPNLFYIDRPGSSWERFVELHQLVKAEIDRRGLDVKVMGSDDGDSLAWFARAVQDDAYFDLTSVYASHIYFPEASLGFLPDIFRDHVGLLRERQPVKPFVIAEFGFRDSRFQPPATNPFMEDYPYALRTQATCITGLNEGVAGFNIWCMHEVYYPGGATPMGFGLWNFADRDWGIRPVYHSMANFMRHTKAGDTVWRCDSSHPAWVRGSRVGDTLFWVNLSDAAVEVTVEGFAPATVRVHTEETLEGDGECGVLLEDVGEGRFTVPGLSFGYALRAGDGAH